MNEIRIATRLQLFRADQMIRASSMRDYSIVTTSEIYSDNTQIVGTTHEVVSAGDVTDDAVLIVENLHATALVRIGGDDTGVFVPWISIPANGPVAILPRASALANTYLISSVASTPIRVTLLKIVAPV